MVARPGLRRRNGVPREYSRFPGHPGLVGVAAPPCLRWQPFWEAPVPVKYVDASHDSANLGGPRSTQRGREYDRRILHVGRWAGHGSIPLPTGFNRKGPTVAPPPFGVLHEEHAVDGGSGPHVPHPNTLRPPVGPISALARLYGQLRTPNEIPVGASLACELLGCRRLLRGRGGFFPRLARQGAGRPRKPRSYASEPESRACGDELCNSVCLLPSRRRSHAY